jgi:cysteine/glycine-rich protein
MSKFGGGGTACNVCQKTAYPAESISFEKVVYHAECFTCSECTKKLEGPSKAAKFDDKVYCHQCFNKLGFAQKQTNTKWTKKETSGSSSVASKFGGGGVDCIICSKKVYPAEQVSYEKQAYHSECFRCSEEDCGKKLSPSGAASFEDKLYCQQCFKKGGFVQKQAKTASKGTSSKSNALASRFGGGGAKCTTCDKTVYAAEQISYEKKPYHPDCFKCGTCGKKMTPAGAASFEDTLYCQKCFAAGGFAQLQAKTASSKGTSSKSNALASRFGGGGVKCKTCDKTVYVAEQINFEKNTYHADCFRCSEGNCNMKVGPSSANLWREDDTERVICSKCWKEGNYRERQTATARA